MIGSDRDTPRNLSVNGHLPCYVEDGLLHRHAQQSTSAGRLMIARKHILIVCRLLMLWFPRAEVLLYRSYKGTKSQYLHMPRAQYNRFIFGRMLELSYRTTVPWYVQIPILRYSRGYCCTGAAALLPSVRLSRTIRFVWWCSD